MVSFSSKHVEGHMDVLLTAGDVGLELWSKKFGFEVEIV